MPARRLLVRKIRGGSPSQARAGVVPPGDSPGLRHWRGHGLAVSAEDGAARVGLAAARGAGRCGARGAVVPSRRPGARPGPARLRVHPPRVEARRRHAAAPLGGVRPGPSERLSPHPVLRDLPAVGAPAAAIDAAGAPRRREDVHRLLGEAADPRRPSHGRGAARRAVRRRARREQPHLRRGDRDPAAARLGRRHTPAWSSTSGARPPCGSPTSSRAPSPVPAATSLASIAPTRTSPPTTAPSSSPRDRGNQGTRLRSRELYFWPSAGYSPDSATRRSSASAP